MESIKLEANSLLFLSIVVLEIRSIHSAKSMRFAEGVDAITVSKLFGISLEECKKECGRRPLCQSVNYFRHIKGCRMKGFVDTTNYVNRRKAVHILLKEYSINGIVSCGGEICQVNEVCDRVTEKCRVEECTILRNPDHGDVLGNLFFIGAKAMFICEHDIYRTYNLIAVCQPDGTWTSSTINCL